MCGSCVSSVPTIGSRSGMTGILSVSRQVASGTRVSRIGSQREQRRQTSVGNSIGVLSNRISTTPAPRRALNAPVAPVKQNMISVSCKFEILKNGSFKASFVCPPKLHMLDADKSGDAMYDELLPAIYEYFKNKYRPVMPDMPRVLPPLTQDGTFYLGNRNGEIDRDSVKLFLTTRRGTKSISLIFNADSLNENNPPVPSVRVVHICLSRK